MAHASPAACGRAGSDASLLPVIAAGAGGVVVETLEMPEMPPFKPAGCRRGHRRSRVFAMNSCLRSASRLLILQACALVIWNSCAKPPEQHARDTAESEASIVTKASKSYADIHESAGKLIDGSRLMIRRAENGEITYRLAYDLSHELLAAAEMIVRAVKVPKDRIQELRQTADHMKADPELRWFYGHVQQAAAGWQYLLDSGFARDEVDEVRQAIGDVILSKNR